MSWFDILVLVILFLSLLGGLKEGAVKNFFYLIALLIVIPISGFSYYLIARILSFLPGTNWENFLGFFITMGLISAIIHLIFLVPRKIIQKIWKRGVLFRLLGGAINVLNTSIGLVVFTLVIGAYPIITWLERVVANSDILARMAEQLSFVQSMLPETFQNAASMVTAGSFM